jgi:hypothetical protein
LYVGEDKMFDLLIVKKVSEERLKVHEEAIVNYVLN